MKLTEQLWNKFDPALREQLAREKRSHYGAFFTDEWYDGLDVEEIEDSVFSGVYLRWLAGRDK